MNTKLVTLAIAILIGMSVYGQNPAEQQAVVLEGKKLYALEMASWYGTDVLLERFPEKRGSIGGYFSYTSGDSVNCLYFAKTIPPMVLAVISFDSTFNVKSARVSNTIRDFTEIENELYTIRLLALNLIRSDSSIVVYNNTNLNVIPLIEGDSRKVFVLTGPQKSGVVIFGNDYLVTFDKNNQVKSKRRLHNNVIMQEYSPDGKIDGVDIVSGTHTHLPETGDLVTSTDICTLMLYAKYTGWESYIVLSDKYVNIWSCKTNSLFVVSKEVYQKIQEGRK